ncbi:MAG: hypothetical protein ACRDJT_14470 [Actinomycetota bacterium]
MKLSALLAGASIVVLGCSASPSSEVARPDAPGPPDPRPEVIERHATQFADELPERPPGSNEEQVAASYILGFLQQAGYPGRLDGVPVADLVRSTNVIGTPPEGATPEYLVAVPYGTPPNQALDARSIGVFLEVARALSVRGLDHPVEFVALGAEFAEQERGTLGSVAMASLLHEESFEPQIIYLSPVLSGDVLYAQGPLAGEFEPDEVANEPAPDRVARAAADVYRTEGFDVTIVDGNAAEAADTLIEFLSEHFR